MLTELIDVCWGHLDHLGFEVTELPRLHPSLEWRPKIRAVRDQYPDPVSVALEVRENGHVDEVLLGPLAETRRLFPDLPIFVAVPSRPDPEMDELLRKLRPLGVGIYIIEEKTLQRVQEAAVPFAADRRAVFPIRPEVPYRNKRNISKMLFMCDEFIHWLDKHFVEKGFDFLYDHLTERQFHGISRVRVLTGEQQVSSAFSRRYHDFRKELGHRGVDMACRTLRSSDYSTVHDRYVIAKNIAFNVLPVGSLDRGQTGELMQTDTPADFDGLWLRGTDVA